MWPTGSPATISLQPHLLENYRRSWLEYVALIAWQIIVNCLLDHAGKFFGAFPLYLGFERMPAGASGVFGEYTALLAA
jgi:hypothetical protein